MRIKQHLILLGICQILTCCHTDLQPKEGQEAPMTREEKRKKDFGQLFGDSFLFFGESKKFNPSSGVGLQINPLLWQASLDVLSFIPLSSADSNGGVIITEWHTIPGKPHERIKIITRINDRQLRADAVSVVIYKQVRKNNDWHQEDVNPSLMTDLEDIILTKARQLKINTGQK